MCQTATAIDECFWAIVYIYIYILFCLWYIYTNCIYYRRKFRSQTSDSMDRWKAEMGRGREKRRVEESRSEKRKSQKKEDADARKGRKVAKHCAFPMICGSGGSKSRLAKAAGAEPSGQMRDEKLHAVVARSTFRSQNVQSTPGPDYFWKLRCWKSARRCGAKQISKSKCAKHPRIGPLLEVEMLKKRTPLWREAHFEVKRHKTPQDRTTFGSSNVEKVHAVVARSTFRSQNVKNTRGSDRFWKLRYRKCARRCGAKHISKSKCTRHHMFARLLEIEMLKKCMPLWCKAHFDVKMYKAPHVCATFGRSDVVSRGRHKGLCTFSRVSKTWGFCSISKNNGRRGAFEEDLQRCISRGRRTAKDMFIRDVRRSGRWFPERGRILEHQICRFAKMILRDRCSTSYDLASLFRGRRCTLDRWSGKIAKRIGTRPSTLHSTFHFWRKSRRIALFLMLSNLKNEEVSQSCFVFDVVKFTNWGSLAEVQRFQSCR